VAKKILAALIVGAAVALATPAAASAVPYTDGGSCSISPTTVRAGGITTLNCKPGTFHPSEMVDYTVSGENGSTANIASYRIANGSAHASKIAAADGGAVLLVTVPRDASGAYTVTGTGATSRAAAAATVTVLPIDAAAGAKASSPSSGTTIAATGSVITGYIAWIGGALVLAGLVVLVIVAGARRRRATP
jgi:hypothetical protein